MLSQHSTLPSRFKLPPGSPGAPEVSAVTEASPAKPVWAAAGGPPAGLVEEATSTTRITEHPGKTLREVRQELSRNRRLSRMRRVVVAHCEAVRTIHGFRSDAVMATLTYAPGVEWNKRQVSRYVDQTVKWAARRGVKIRYQWVVELQRRGAPHYHVLFWVPHGFKLPKPDESGHWPHGMSRIELARKAVGYLVKYATKGDDSMSFPHGARLFGCGGEPCARHPAHRAGLPRWLDVAATPGEHLDRVAGVGWVERETGAAHRSPFSMLFEPYPGGIRLIVRRVLQ